MRRTMTLGAVLLAAIVAADRAEAGDPYRRLFAVQDSDGLTAHADSKTSMFAQHVPRELPRPPGRRGATTPLGDAARTGGFAGALAGAGVGAAWGAAAYKDAGLGAALLGGALGYGMGAVTGVIDGALPRTSRRTRGVRAAGIGMLVSTATLWAVGACGGNGAMLLREFGALGLVHGAATGLLTATLAR